jgi:hypothetical protein
MHAHKHARRAHLKWLGELESVKYAAQPPTRQSQVNKYKSMAINYVKGWFVIDCVSSVPAETAIAVATAIAKTRGTFIVETSWDMLPLWPVGASRCVCD